MQVACKVNKVVAKWDTLMWGPLYHVSRDVKNTFSPYVFHDMSKSSIIPNANAIRNAVMVNANPNFTPENCQSQ